MWGLLAGLLWVVSFITFPTKANGFWFPKDMAWLLGSFLLASSPWWNPPSRPSLRLPALGWLFAWIMLSFSWFVLWPQLTIPQVEVGMQRVVGMRWYVSPILPTLTWLGSLLAIDALVRHTDHLTRWHRVALHLVRIGGVLSVLVISQRIGLNPLESVYTIASNSPWQTRTIGLLGNATVMGNFLAILAPLCLMFSARRYRWGAFGLMVSAIIITGSVMSLGVVLVSSLVVWLLQRRWRWVIGSVILALLTGVWAWLWLSPATVWNYVNPHGRWDVWRTAFTFWTQIPLNAWIGYGAGSVGAATANGIWNYGFLHNDYLQWTFEFGLIGLVLMGWAVGHALSQLRWMTWTGASTAWVGAAVAYGLLMLTGFPLHIGSLLMVGVVIAAAVLSHCQPQGGSDAEG